MSTLEDAYKEYELDKFFKFNNNTNEFSQQFGQITNLPPIEKSFMYKQPLIKKYGLKRENIIPLGVTKDLYCLQDTSTKIYYPLNAYCIYKCNRRCMRSSFLTGVKMHMHFF